MGQDQNTYILTLNADWCNSNIDDSWSSYLGANPKFAYKGYSLIGKANHS